MFCRRLGFPVYYVFDLIHCEHSGEQLLDSVHGAGSASSVSGADRAIRILEVRQQYGPDT